ncbi:AmmeMemoRadiSam system protein B [Candidatus Margulisiibacteriota bacterium]
MKKNPLIVICLCCAFVFLMTVNSLAVVEGMFYPADKAALSKTIDRFFQNVPDQKLPGEPRALIVPHAGYNYSGQTAAYGFKTLQGLIYDTVIVIGTSHQTFNDTISLYNKDYYSTPLGKIKIDKTITRRLINSHKKIVARQEPFSKEHSLEVELPFLQKTLKDFSLVMIAMENQSYENILILKEQLIRLFKERPEKILIVVSTDLSHYYTYPIAVIKDKLAVELILKGDVLELVKNINNRTCEMCGFGGVLALTYLADEMGWKDRKLLYLNNSGDVPAGDKKRVVGYASIAYFERGKTEMLNESEQKVLLELARNTIKNELGEKPLPSTDTDSLRLGEVNGVFVTLKKNGQLRGCIGNIIGVYPLIEGVQKMALSAAFSDPRFPPLREDEYKDIHIEISVLTPPRRIQSVDEIEVGRHGIILKKGFNQGVLLPQVPVEWNWDLDEYLVGISRKSGLPPDGWKGAELFVFEAQVFGEE